jgi:hypothetical protein
VIAKKAETNRDLFDWLEFGSIEQQHDEEGQSADLSQQVAVITTVKSDNPACLR